MKRMILLAGAVVTASLALAGGGCADDPKPAFVEAQYTVEYLSRSDTRQRVGELSENLGGGDFYGYCSATTSSGVKTISIQVADPNSWPTVDWMLKFDRLVWPVDSTTSVTCDKIEIYDETVGSASIPCSSAEGGCTVTVSRNEDLKDTVQIWFSCNEFETNVSTGGVPNKMSVNRDSMAAIQVQNCDGF